MCLLAVNNSYYTESILFCSQRAEDPVEFLFVRQPAETVPPGAAARQSGYPGPPQVPGVHVGRPGAPLRAQPPGSQALDHGVGEGER